MGGVSCSLQDQWEQGRGWRVTLGGWGGQAVLGRAAVLDKAGNWE